MSEKPKNSQFIHYLNKTYVKIPALIDIHVHLREPGDEHKETFDTGMAAARN